MVTAGEDQTAVYFVKKGGAGGAVHGQDGQVLGSKDAGFCFPDLFLKILEVFIDAP